MEQFESLYKKRKQVEEQRASQLARELMKRGREADLFRAARDAKFRERLYLEFGI